MLHVEVDNVIGKAHAKRLAQWKIAIKMALDIAMESPRNGDDDALLESRDMEKATAF